jgi:HD-GYP domain-containing protein (c-di-GMP phosphodiesterase class II)
LVFGFSKPAGIAWLIIAVAGGAVALASVISAAQQPQVALAAALLALAGAIAETFVVDLPMPRPGPGISQSVGAAISIAAIIVLPTPWAVISVAIAMGIGRRRDWPRRIFNITQIALSTAAAGSVWHGLGGARPPSDVHQLPWLVLTVGVYFAVSSTLLNVVIGLHTGLPIALTWWRAYRHIWPAKLAIYFVGVLLAVLWTTSPWTIALATLPLAALYYTLRNTVSLEKQTREALFNLADILDARDPYTHGHSLRVGEYSEKLALHIGLAGDDAYLVYLSGRLHDIGKCAVKNEVLLKPGALDDEERAHMCIHPDVGSSMLNSFSLFKECAAFVRGHHERWDGNGYPDGLKGENIPLGARVIAVVDAYDAMTTTRPYRTALPQAEAFRRLSAGAGTQWDARVVRAFLAMLDAQIEPTPLPVSGETRLPDAA